MTNHSAVVGSRSARLRVTAGATALVVAGLVLSGTVQASAAEEEFSDQAALNTSCVEEVDGLGVADRCRFEPWTKENFTADVVRVSGDTVNCTDVNATKSISWSQATTEEHSIQVSAAAELKLSEAFAVSITTTFGHSWAHTTTETATEIAPVPARSVAWIERGAPMQRVKGRMVINYPKRRHGHFEWYTYPTVTNADPQALSFSTVVLRSRPITPQEDAALCGRTAPVGAQATAEPGSVLPPSAATTLRTAQPPTTIGTVPDTAASPPHGG